MIVTADDLTRVRATLRGTVDLSGMKDGQLSRRITSFCNRHSLAGPDELVVALRGDDDVRAAFLDRLTINVTSVYRNPERWADLEAVVAGMGPRPRMWSAGCASGAEAHSLAIAGLRAGGDPSVLGSDIDRESLARARAGRYPADALREAPAEVVGTYFLPSPEGFTVAGEVARRVRFEHRDLLGDPPPSALFDVVACRNVVIYLSAPGRRRLHTMLAGRLRPGGVLFVGNAERVDRPGDLGLEPLSPQMYRKAV